MLKKMKKLFINNQYKKQFKNGLFFMSNFVVRLILKSIDKWKNIPYNKNTFKKFLNQIIFFYKNSNNNNP